MRASILVGMVVALHLGDARAQDWGPRRDPFDRVVIAKYQSLLVRDPHDVGLSKLVDLYKRFRSIALLVTEYEAKLAASPDDLTLVVIAGRLREVAGDRDGAIELYTRALAGNPGDASTAIRFGNLLRGAGRLVDARNALEHTLEHGGVVTGKPQRDLVRALADLTYLMRDRVGAAGYAIRFAALDPTNARAHIDRGDALLAIGFPERAAESYALAEPLLGTDTSRKLDVIAARGRALEKSRPDEAVAEYRRAIALAPRGHYLREELFGRIVEIHRRTYTMPALLARTQTDWPEPTRGVFEWSQLATMFDAVGSRDEGTAALSKAVARSADARLHLQLADRYETGDKRAFTIIDALAIRMQRDISVMISIAERYARWGQLANAIATYEKVVKLDPVAEERFLGLIETPLRAGDEVAARIALRNVVQRLRKPATFARLGEVLLEWGLYREADEIFGKALELDRKNPALWRGRAAARNSLGELAGAVADAQRVIVLTSDPKTRRHARKDLVRIVMHASSNRGGRAPYVDSWREAFNAEPADIDAGYLLLEYYQRAPCEIWNSARHTCEREVVTVLDRLSRIAPVDFDDVISLATTHAAARRHHEALEILHLLSRIAPDRVSDIEKHRAKIADWRTRSSYRYHHSNRSYHSLSWIHDPDGELAAHRRRRLGQRDREAIAAPIRAGVRIGAGTGVRGDADHVVTVGTQAAARIARNLFITSRLDYTERQSTNVPISALAMSIGVGSVIRTTRSTALVVGLAQRLERRFGDMIEEAGLSRAGFSTDLTLDLVGRKIPLGVGARLEQGLSEDARSTALMLELTLELR